MGKNFIEVGETLAVPHHCGICDNDFLNYVDDENLKKGLGEQTKIVKSMEIISFVTSLNEGQTKSPDFYINEIK